jgi:hypothetical protein
MAAALPEGWLDAQADAWPLRSAYAFAHALVEPGDGDHRALAAEFEAFYRTRTAGISLDALDTLTRTAWHRLRGAGCMRRHLETMADQSLAWSGDRVVLRAAEDTVRALVRWRWLSLTLPPDLLIAVLSAQHRHDPRTESVTLPDRNLGKVFAERPFAVTHLHVGASVSFGPLWAGVMRRLGSEDLPTVRTDAGTPAPIRTPELFQARLLQAAITRLILASFLWHREAGAWQGGGIVDFISSPDPAPGLARVCRRVRWAWGTEDAALVLADALRSLVQPRDDVRAMRAWHTVYRGLVAPPPQASAAYADVAASDPLAMWLAPEGTATSETRFVRRACEYLEATPGDRVFTQAFWQYQRIRVLSYQYLVEERGTAGLEWFSRHYQRISGLRKPFDAFLFEAAFATEGRGLSLRSLEGRTAPEADWGAIRDMVRGVAENARRIRPRGTAPRPEIGLVLHFIKHRSYKAGGREWPHADPSQPVFRCRYGRWFADRLTEANAIVRALERHPELLYVLRGVDVANVELAIPSWAVAPLIRTTRRASHAAAAACTRRWPEWEVEPLRATWHAGEDFMRLVQGLRAIHEPIEAGAIGAADRLGHAVALGLHPERWAEAAGEVTQRAEDRLDDLLWEWDRYACGDVAPESGRLLRVEREIERLAKNVYPRQDLSIPTFAAARRLRLQPGMLAMVGYLGNGWASHPLLAFDTHVDGGLAGKPGLDLGGNGTDARAVLCGYLSDARAYERGCEPIRVKTEAGELAFLAEAQRWLARRLEALSITVETNPSSNLLIADFVDLEEHPAFRLEPLRADDPTGLGVAITINSDNPLTFATSLGDEYTYMYAGLRRAKVTGGAALDWLERVRQAAWRARFTLPASTEDAVLDLVAPPPSRPARR